MYEKKISPDDIFERTAAIVSPCYSCGLGHLFEVFLLFDVRVDIFGQKCRYWEQNKDNSWNLTSDGKSHFRLHSRYVDDSYSFSDQKSIISEHKLSMINVFDQYKNKILLVRDPIDAIHSWFRRYNLQDTGITFLEYLTYISVSKEHYPHALFQARPLEVYALYCVFWMLYSEDLKICRFEDIKGNRLAWSSFLRDLDIYRPDTEFRYQFEKIQEPFSKSQSSYFHDNNKAGKQYEYLDWMTAKQHDDILQSSGGRDLFADLGYCCFPTKSGIFGHDTRLKQHLWDVCDQLKVELLTSEGKFRVVDFLSNLNATFFSSALGFVDYRKTAAFWALDAADLNFLNTLRSVIQFLAEVYCEKQFEDADRLIRLAIGLTSFLSKNMSSMGGGFYLQNKII